MRAKLLELCGSILIVIGSLVSIIAGNVISQAYIFETNSNDFARILGFIFSIYGISFSVVMGIIMLGIAEIIKKLPSEK